MRAWKDVFQSAYCMGSPLNVVGLGTGRRLILNESVIAVAIAAALAIAPSALGIGPFEGLKDWSRNWSCGR